MKFELRSDCTSSPLAHISQSPRPKDMLEIQNETFESLIKKTFPSEHLQKRILEARDEMIYLHSDQEPRDDGVPYPCHPLEVATAVIELFGVIDPNIIISALFHDSLEDQAKKILESYTIDALNEDELISAARIEMQARWGGNVAHTIALLTNPNFTELARQLQESGDTRALQDIKHGIYKDHVLHLLDHSEAFIVKMGDFASNVLKVFLLEECQQKKKLINKYTPVVLSLLEASQETHQAPYIDQVLAIMKPEFEKYMVLFNEREQ
jgi:hypothetical protein